MKNKFKIKSIQIETIQNTQTSNIKIAIYKMTPNAVRNVLKNKNGKLARSLWSKRPTATLGWAIRNIRPIFLFARTSSILTTSSAASRVHETKDRRSASTAIWSFVGKQSVITFLFSSVDNQLFFNRRYRIFGQQQIFQFNINLISRICSAFVRILCWLLRLWRVWRLNVFCWLWRWFHPITLSIILRGTRCLLIINFLGRPFIHILGSIPSLVSRRRHIALAKNQWNGADDNEQCG